MALETHTIEREKPNWKSESQIQRHLSEMSSRGGSCEMQVSISGFGSDVGGYFNLAWLRS
jgi:hypothetical protein